MTAIAGGLDDAIDLRSDTVTRPTPAMRRAMFEAPVGDDVYGEDPTVRALEERVADLLGMDEAVFVPSGTMANQIALALLTRRGDEVVVGAGSHNWLYETGGAAALAGVQMAVIAGDGRFTGADVRAAYKPDDVHFAPTAAVSVENPHTQCGGAVWDRDALAGVLSAADELGLAAHLDGARLWNAAVACGASERELAAGFDTVAVCLSKSLGAPVGSLVCGRRDRMRGARRVRKRLGGGMRQAGILAAAGLYAIEHHRARIEDDHANARAIAAAVAAVPGMTPGGVDTSIVMVEVARELGTAADVVAAARARGLLIGAMGPTRIRMVAHLDVDRAACERAADILAAVAGELTRGDRLARS